MLFFQKQMMFHAAFQGEAGAEGAKAEAVKKAKENALTGNESVTAQGMAGKVLGEIDKVDADEAAKAAARGKVDAAGKEFEDFVANLSKRKSVDDQAKKLDPTRKDFDFLHAQEVIKSAAGDLAAIKGVFGDQDSVVTKFEANKTSVNVAARSMYEGMLTGLDGHSMQNRNDFWYFMQEMGKLHEAKFRGFAGAGEGDLDQLKKDFDAKIKLAQAELDKAVPKAAELKLTKEDLDSYDRLGHAVPNLAAAEGSDNEQILGGAKEYMEMVTAEQEARRVFWSLPFDANDPSKCWRAAELTQDVNWPNAPDAATKYNAARKAFADATSKAGTFPPQSYEGMMDAKKLFKQAADLWREVGAIPVEQAIAKETDTTLEKAAYETSYTNFKSAYDKISPYGLNAVALLKQEHKDLYVKKTPDQLNGMGKVDLEALNRQVDTAKDALDKLKTFLDGIKTRYDQVLKGSLDSYLAKDKADVTDGQEIAKCVHAYMNNPFYLTEVKNEYGGQPAMNILDGLGIFAKNDYNMSRVAGGEKVWYNVSVSYLNGVPQVTVKRQEGDSFVQNSPTAGPVSAPAVSSDAGVSQPPLFTGGKGMSLNNKV